MVYSKTLSSPLGYLTLVASGARLCGLYFEGHRPAPQHIDWIEKDAECFDAVQAWLTAYFAGRPSSTLPAITWLAGTPFQRRVWDALCQIPHGQTTTYAQLARSIGASTAIRAVGAAIARNPISILVPCHRVIGSDGSLTGFAGGAERKRWLLENEGVFFEGQKILNAA